MKSNLGGLAWVATMLAVTGLTGFSAPSLAGPSPAPVTGSPVLTGKLYGTLTYDGSTSAMQNVGPYTDVCEIYAGTFGDVWYRHAPIFKSVHPDSKGHYEVTLPCGHYTVTLPHISAPAEDFPHAEVDITPHGKVRCNLQRNFVWGG